MEETKYNEELKDICKQLAYVAFTNHGYTIFKDRNITHEDINNFVVTIFFSSCIEDDNTSTVDLDVRFTVFIDNGGSNNQEITFMFHDKKILDSIVDKFFKEEFGVVQKYEWTFPKPNGIELFDAQLTLYEELGIE